jgi:hypothetical protein
MAADRCMIYSEGGWFESSGNASWVPVFSFADGSLVGFPIPRRVHHAGLRQGPTSPLPVSPR